MRFQIILSIVVLLFVSGKIYAQDFTLKVWPKHVPNAIANADYQEITEYINNGQSPRVSRVTDPELLVFLPKKEVATGAAVIICPGGGYGRLAMDVEGVMVAEWLQEMGVAGIILKYRLPSDKIMTNKSVGPLQDAQEAIRLVRKKASEWGIDISKIGIMGFSAGGHLASTLSTQYDANVYPVTDAFSAKPDFSILIYPVISMKDGITHNGSRTNLLGEKPNQEMIEKFSNENHITPDTPPTFLILASDDSVVIPKNSLLYYEALLKNKVPAEMHIYQTGGHGFGLGKGRGTPEGWPENCKKWLQAREIIGK